MITKTDRISKKVLIVYKDIEQLENVDKKKELPTAIVIEESQYTNKLINSIKKLKNNPKTSHIPILLINKNEKFIDRFIEAGINDYFENKLEMNSRLKLNIKRSQEYLDANPLTRLPGNRRIRQKIKENKSSSVIYIDINNFKKYNDRNGFLAGDKIIKKVAKALMKAISIDQESFLGHIGGDDFVVITQNNNLVEKIKLKLLEIKEVTVSVKLIET